MECVLDDSFDAALRHLAAGRKPVVLDFASGTNPGGGWRGRQRGTQEESLCRRGNLGALLEARRYPIPQDGMHFVEGVTIERDAELRPLPRVRRCAVIASELKAISSRSEDYLRMRIARLYEAVLARGYDTLVLGLWGCGAFGEADDDHLRLAEAMRVVRARYADRVFTVYAVRDRAKFGAFARAVAARAS